MKQEEVIYELKKDSPFILNVGKHGVIQTILKHSKGQNQLLVSTSNEPMLNKVNFRNAKAIPTKYVPQNEAINVKLQLKG